MKHGALHNPDHPLLLEAGNYLDLRSPVIDGPTPNWFAASPPDGDALWNNEVSDCCEAADFRLIQFWLAAQDIVWRIPRDLVMRRYVAVGGYQHTMATDVGTSPAVDMFAWMTNPIEAYSRFWPVYWASVPLGSITDALRRGPLLATLGLPVKMLSYPERWHMAPQGAFMAYHRVVIGYAENGMLLCRSYGRNYWVNPALVVGADLLIPHTNGAPLSLEMAGIDYTKLT